MFPSLFELIKGRLRTPTCIINTFSAMILPAIFPSSIPSLILDVLAFLSNLQNSSYSGENGPF